jgi:AraC-like DNA-binding protein
VPYTIRSASLVKFAEAAKVVGLDAEHVFHHVGIDSECMVQRELQVPVRWLADIFDATERRSSFGSAGLLVAGTWRMSDFGPLALLLQHQPTLRHALGVFESYRHLRSHVVTLHIRETGEMAVIQLLLHTERGPAGRHPVELSLGSLMAMLRWFLGAGWSPREVRFSHGAPRQLDLHRRLFGCPLEFGCESDCVVLRRADLDQPGPFSDIHLARYAKDFLDLLAPGQHAPTSLSVRRSMEVLLPQGRCTIEDVAAQMGTSSRTLQRRLAAESAEFSLLLNEVRRALASRYLGDPRYPVGQVAGLLGFAEPSAFSRWFGAQFGRSPRQWRAEPSQ